MITSAPLWAIAILDATTTHTLLTWKTRAWYPFSTGWASDKEIEITAGWLRFSKEHTLLHEIAHVRVGIKHGHDEIWGKDSVNIYQLYGLPVWVCRLMDWDSAFSVRLLAWTKAHFLKRN